MMKEDICGTTKNSTQSENMARPGGDDIQTARAPSVDREERLRFVKEKQNQERQRKLEELKQQTLEAQKFREQKEEERKRRMEEMRNKELDKKTQVDERKKAIQVAERERIEFIMQKNLDRDSRMENKKRANRSSIGFAFGSSTPRLLDPVDSGSVSPSSFWSHRRSTSITNVDFSGGQVSRRSCEREFGDTPKKRATSAGGLNRSEDDSTENTAPVQYRSVARRKTDLMPTIPSPRDSFFGSRSSLYCHTPRTPGKTPPSASTPTTRRAVSMTRLDQLAQPVRRNGEHIRAVIEKQRQMESAMSCSFSSQTSSQLTTTSTTANSAKTRSMSRSTTHLADNNNSSNITSTQKRLSTTSPMHNIDRTKYLTKSNSPANASPTGSRSGDVTPGSSRPSSAMNTSMSMSGVVNRRPNTTPRKPRPASIASTGIKVESNDIPKDKKDKPPLHSKPPSSARKSLVLNGNSPAAANIKSQAQMTKSMESPKPAPSEKRPSIAKKPTNVKTHSSKEELSRETQEKQTKQIPPSVPIVDEKLVDKSQVKCEDLITISSDITSAPIEHVAEVPAAVDTLLCDIDQNIENQSEPSIAPTAEKSNEIEKQIGVNENLTNLNKPIAPSESYIEEQMVSSEMTDAGERQDNIDMTASMIKRITTEEEAKAALAERRRLAREEMERQAELERQRIEAERQAELERIAEEERRQKFLEEESTRLAEEQRKAEEMRLLHAIEEAKQRDELERVKREEDERLKLEKEENERKAKQEAEKQKLEAAERLKKEEKEREERRKRVELIMSRTRAKAQGNTPNKTNGKDDIEDKNVNSLTSDINLVKNDHNSSSLSENQAAPEIDLTTNSTESLLVNNVMQANNSSETIKTTPTIIDYEKSVTEKENKLMNSFRNLIENNKNIDDINNTQNYKINGKLSFESKTNNVDDEQLIEKCAISDENNHSPGHSVDNKIESNVGNIYGFIDNKTQDSLTDQLINLNIENSADTVNFNNNNSLLTNTTLVTSDSHDNNKEISLL